jgi:hypothetical protein
MRHTVRRCGMAQRPSIVRLDARQNDEDETTPLSRINIGSNKRIMTFFELDLAISAFVPLAVVTHVVQ